MDRTRLTLVDLQLRLLDAVLAKRNTTLLGQPADPLGQLMLHRLPSLGPRTSNGANWTWSCPGAPAALQRALKAHADALQRQFDLA